MEWYEESGSAILGNRYDSYQAWCQLVFVTVESLCSATQVVDDLINRAKDGEPVDWRYHLGEDVYFIIKAPQLTIHIRKHFVPNAEWTLHPTNIGVTLSLYEWKELKKTILLFEDRGPELRTMDKKVTGED